MATIRNIILGGFGCFFIAFTPFESKGQQANPFHPTDSIKVSGGSHVIVGHRDFYVANDTVLLVPFGTFFKTTNDKDTSKSDFYEAIRKKAERSKLTKELYNLVFVTPPVTRNNVYQMESGKSETPFLLYQGRTIRNIKIQQLDVFGPTFADTSYKTKTWLGKAANNLHINTKQYVIRKNLLFRQGDTLNPYMLSDNERILREQPFLEDARIIVIPSKTDTNSVDVLVITKDVFSIGVDLSVNTSYSGYVKLYDKNLLGFGQELLNVVDYNYHKQPSLGYQGRFSMQNLYKTFINSQITYENGFGKEEYQVNLSKGFVTTAMKYAGGITLTSMHTYTNDEIDPTRVKYNNQDVWIGRSLSLGKLNRYFSRSSIIFAGRIYSTQFTQRPYTTIDSNVSYQNNTTLLASLSFSKRNYYKSNLIYSFGRTEDIPYGHLFTLTLGNENNEFSERIYTSIQYSKGGFVEPLNLYYYYNLALGSYRKNHHFEDGILSCEGQIISRLFALNKYYFRHFIKVNYTTGINYTDNNLLTLNNDYGIRGFNSGLIHGGQKLTLRLETVCFTPFNVLEFRLATYAFADIGLIGSSPKFIFTENCYEGIGIGIRVRNEHLVLKTFQIQFAYYPGGPQDIQSTRFDFMGVDDLRFNDFSGTAPHIIPFQ